MSRTRFGWGLCVYSHTGAARPGGAGGAGGKMTEFLQLAIAGAATGAIYSLIASGLVLSYTSTGIFNLAYGSIAFVCALLYYELNTGLGWPIVPAFLFVLVVFCPLLGMLLDVAVFRPLAKAPDAAKIMATVGLLVALPAIARFVLEGGINTFGWGIPDAKLVPQVPGIWRSPPSTSHLWFDVTLDSNRIVVFVTAVIVAVLLWVLLRRTRLGLQMRAVVDRPHLAGMRGVDDGRTSAAAWIIGTMLAGLAGVVGAPVLNNLTPEQFNIVMFIAIAAAVLGGLRSVPLAFAGGLLIGMLENLVARYATFADDIQGFGSSVPFVLLLIGLLVMSRDKSRSGGSITTVPPPIDWADDLPRWRRALPWGIATVLFTIWVFFIVNEFWLGLLTGGLAYAVVFMSFVVVTGQGGMVSLAQATFVSMAGLVAGLCMVRWDWPWLPAAIAGTAIAMVLGTLVALPALRLGGLPLALATLALAFVGERVLFKWDWLRNGPSGWVVGRPKFGPFDLDDTRTMTVTLMIIVAAMTWIVFNLQRSASGRTIIAVRNSEPAASTSGLSIVRTKMAIFAVSAAIAGFGGVLVVTYNKAISDISFPTGAGLVWLATVVLMGIRKPQGAILAGLSISMSSAIFNNGFHFAFTPTWLQWDGLGASTSTYVSSILFGLGAVQLAREPDGILAITAAQNRRRRDRRRATRGESVELVDPAAISASIEAEAEQMHDAAAGTAPVVMTTIGASTEVDASDATLVLEDVRSGYGLVEVLHGVTLPVRAGQITVLLGPNGAGKSTTCSTIAGTVGVSSGAIRFRGDDVSSLKAHQRARRGIVLAPEARGIFPGLTVRENLQMWLPSGAQRDAVYDRFPILGQRQAQPAGNLSGGEQQILTLAPLLVNPPEVLVADEPSLGLAPLVVDQIMGLFVELCRAGSALLLVEEKARDVLAIADTVAFLSLGRVTWVGPRAEVDEQRVAEAYLGASLARSSHP
jgi:branched-subunit amino acid ABC-type transport system permease component/ABC-type branched-subunit amino acid transport system ATPase component